MHDRVEEVLRDDEVEPTNESGVDGHPLGIPLRKIGVDGAVDMVMEVVLVEDQGEIGLPGVVGGVGLI